MRFVMKAVILVGYLASGCLLLSAQDVLTEQVDAPSDIEQQTAQIGKASTVILTVETSDGKVGNEGMLEDFNVSIRLGLDYAPAYVNRGVSKIRLRDYKGAIEDCDTAIRLDPNLAEAYKIRGDAKSNLGNHNTAIIDYDIAVHLKPDYPEAYYKRGIAKFEIGNVSEAKIDFRTALKLAESEGTQSFKDDIERSLHLFPQSR